MRMLQAYKSRKYLLRILLSLTLLMVAGLFLISVALQYNAERGAVRMQREANRKVMNQIDYNIAYMTDHIGKLAVNLYAEKRVVALMTMREPDEMTVIESVNNLHKSYILSSFLHSIIVYNGYADRTYAIGELSSSKPDQEMAAKLVDRLKQKEKLPRMELLPMNMSGREHGVDFFSLVIYETYYPTNTGRESALVLNIKPEWLLDNLRAINDFASPDSSGIFIAGRDGDVILSSVGERLMSDLETLNQAVLGVGNGDGNGEGDGDPEQKPFGSMTTRVAGEGEVLVTYLRGDPWTVISVQPYDQVLGGILEMRKTSAWVGGVFLLMAIVGSVIVAHRLYGPVERMIAEIGGGSAARTAERRGRADSRDELSHVATLYSEMAQTLSRVSSEKDQQRSIVRNYYLRTILTSARTLTAGQFADLIRQNGLNIEERGPYRLVIVKIDGYLRLQRSVGYDQRMLYDFAIRNIAEDIMGHSPIRCEIADMRSDHIVMLTSGDHAREEGTEALAGWLGRIQETISAYYKLTLTMSIGDVLGSHDLIAEGYARAIHYSMYKLVFGQGAILTPEQVRPNMDRYEYAFPDELERRLLESARSNDLDGMLGTIDLILERLSVYHYDHILHGLLHVANVLKGAVRDMNKHRVVSLQLDLSSISREVLEKDTIGEIRELFAAACAELHDRLLAQDEEKNKALMDTIKDIVEANYRDRNLSLQGIASMLHMTPAYVGAKFKQSEFISVAEFMNEVRLRHAQEYLETKNFSIKEIMELVGYFNESTFFKLFKKKYGVTPREYRLKKRLE
ncbi:helix-turn-helix domain-containing protein [Paenibacillus methanolicus]|uniref:Helix-turn-helix protein n=1 Tax=Paenibacillus methanolicus TaxID=582686 RepID=A0A5S5CLM6_9BACL|nr:helix-turn-helix domain-containing protein [Paenibacillus methanolicus]TYP79863.1 helix-turn-helix protein [Paenibacillus methanolicus]